jgi:hypothetical protein
VPSWLESRRFSDFSKARAGAQKINKYLFLVVSNTKRMTATTPGAQA